MFRQRNWSPKYKNAKTVYEGIQYHSKAESLFAAELDLRKRAKDIKGWERQRKISLDVNGHHIANYYIDFVIQHNDGTEEFVEVKGFPTEVWRLKWLLFEALFSNDPMIKLSVVKV